MSTSAAKQHAREFRASGIASLDGLGRDLFDSAPDPSYVVTAEGAIVAASDAAVTQLGWTREELEGMSLAEIDDRHSSEQIREFLALCRDASSEGFETVHRTRKGARIPVEARCTSLSATGKELFHLIARDATDRQQIERGLRQSEHKYRSLVDGMREMVWLVQQDGRLADVNDRTCETLGYSRAELLELAVRDIDVDLSEERATELGRQLLKDRFQIFETLHTTKDGQKLPVEVQSALIQYRDEWHILCIVRDITERKKAEQERIRLEKLQSIGLLAGGIAHDFNNLLLALHGNVEMAREHVEPEGEASVYLAEVDASLERATHLTQQFLTFATGGDPVKKRLRLGDSLAETATFSLRGTNALLESDIAEDLWPVDADPGQIDQVVANLVLNAQQAMPEGGTVMLAARNVEAEAARAIEIEVRDSGIGIHDRDLERIFDPYFTTKDAGRGLGLSVCLSVVHEHDGTIAARSEPGEGSTFTVRLPAAPVVEPEPEEPVRTDHEADHGTRKTILVMDDDDAVRRVLVRLLTRIGHEVDEARDGEQACERYESALRSDTPFDLVIMDLTIPGGMSGKEAAQHILQLDAEARLLASSGYAADPVLAQPARFGFCGAIAKPYRLAALKAEIEAATALGAPRVIRRER